MVKLQDTLAVEEFMTSFGQEVHDTPVTNPSPELRLLRGSLTIEEAFELLVALGLKFSIEGELEPITVDPKKVKLFIDPDAEYDIVETMDALVDLNVVNKGAGSALGLPLDDGLLDEVSPSNMSKLGEDGKPIYREDGKILKGPNYFTPVIKRSLKKAGWVEDAVVVEEVVVEDNAATVQDLDSRNWG